MATEKQIAANRANAKKSSGPRTTIGKQKSSRNATRHGLTSRTFLSETESGPPFVEHLQNYQVVWKPTSFLEERLVWQMAVAKWRQQHVWQVEALHLNAAARKSGTASIAFAELADTSALELLGRYDERFSRQYDHAVTRLMKLRKIKY
jgi:hypothetical protein